MGGKNRAGSQPWIPIALATTSVADLLHATNLTRSAWAKYRSFSLYSLIAVVATFAAFPFVVPEAIIAIRKLRPFNRTDHWTNSLSWGSPTPAAAFSPTKILLPRLPHCRSCFSVGGGIFVR
jgi:hypothetical protein